jgi:hypothetical protein
VARVLHPEQIAAAAALGADEVPDWLNDQDAGRSLGPRQSASPPVLAGETAVRTQVPLAPYDPVPIIYVHEGTGPLSARRRPPLRGLRPARSGSGSLCAGRLEVAV